MSFQYEVVEPPDRLVFAEPQTGITTQISLRPSGRGTAVVVHQWRLPPEPRTEQARTGVGTTDVEVRDLAAEFDAAHQVTATRDTSHQLPSCGSA